MAYPPEKQREYQREWRKRNRDKNRDYQRSVEQRNRKFVADSKVGKSCPHCEESDPICLDYHHRNPAEKKFSLSRPSKRGITTIRIEMMKCDLICSNCHRKLHRGGS